MDSDNSLLISSSSEESSYSSLDEDSTEDIESISEDISPVTEKLHATTVIKHQPIIFDLPPIYKDTSNIDKGNDHVNAIKSAGKVIKKQNNLDQVNISKKAHNKVMAMRRIQAKRIQKKTLRERKSTIRPNIFTTPVNRVLTQSGTLSTITITQPLTINSCATLRRFQENGGIVGPIKLANEIQRTHMEGIQFYFTNTIPPISWEQNLKDAIRIGISFPAG